MSARKYIRQRRAGVRNSNGNRRPFDIADLLDVIGNEREIEKMKTLTVNLDDFLHEGKLIKLLKSDSGSCLELLILKLRGFLKKFEDGAVVRVGGKDWKLTEVDAEEYEVESEWGDRTIAKYRVPKGADNDNGEEE